jgi:hypothetical protein
VSGAFDLSAIHGTPEWEKFVRAYVEADQRRDRERYEKVMARYVKTGRLFFGEERREWGTSA